MVSVMYENGVRGTGEACEYVRAKILKMISLEKGCGVGQGFYIYWADEVFVPHQYVRHSKSEDDRTDPRSNKTLNSLLRRKLDELGTTEGNATDVCKNVIGDNQGCWEEEPDHPLENVVHDEVGLHDN